MGPPLRPNLHQVSQEVLSVTVLLDAVGLKLAASSQLGLIVRTGEACFEHICRTVDVFLLQANPYVEAVRAAISVGQMAACYPVAYFEQGERAEREMECFACGQNWPAADASPSALMASFDLIKASSCVVNFRSFAASPSIEDRREAQNCPLDRDAAAPAGEDLLT